MMDVLRRQKAHSFMRGLDHPVFLNPVSGTPWPDVQDQRQLYFHPALRALGIRSRDAYQTRHSYATLALMSGVSPAYIARQLGHATTAMLFQNYSRWIDGGDDGREARKLNAIFGNQNREFSHIFPTGTYAPDRGELSVSNDFKMLPAEAAMAPQQKMVTPTGLEPVFSP